MTNVTTTMKLASDSDAIARRASAWGAGLSMALCVMVLIASEFMPVSLLTPLASDLRMTQGQAGQAISVSGIFAVGVAHGVALDGAQLFFTHVRLHGGPAPVRRYLPNLIDLVLDGRINPGRVFDQVLPLDQVAEGYRAMDERRAIKTLLRP